MTMRIDDSNVRAKLRNVSECVHAPVLRWYQFRLVTLFAAMLLMGVICLPLTRWPRLTGLFGGILLQVSFTVLLLRAWHRLRAQVPAYDIADRRYLLFSLLLVTAVVVAFLWPHLAIALLAAVPPIAVTDYLYRKYMASAPEGSVVLGALAFWVFVAWVSYVLVIISGPMMAVFPPLGPFRKPLISWWCNYWIEWGHYFGK